MLPLKKASYTCVLVPYCPVGFYLHIICAKTILFKTTFHLVLMQGIIAAQFLDRRSPVYLLFLCMGYGQWAVDYFVVLVILI